MLKLTKTYTIDIQHEHKRIDKAFNDDADTRWHLHELIDLVEACKWEDAYNLLSNDWWTTYCPKLECSRLEFIGGIHTLPENLFNWHYSYLDLIKDMLTYTNYTCFKLDTPKETPSETTP